MADRDNQLFIFGNDHQGHHSHLGWEFIVFRKSDIDAKGSDIRHGLRYLARRECGLGGEKWIDDLVSTGKAVPQNRKFVRSYIVNVEVLKTIIEVGIPKHEGPDVIGDDYFMPGGWACNACIDWVSLKSFPRDELLIVDMFDQS